MKRGGQTPLGTESSTPTRWKNIKAPCSRAGYLSPVYSTVERQDTLRQDNIQYKPIFLMLLNYIPLVL